MTNEDYRRECEARHVLSLPFPKRRPYLDGVEKHRGPVGRKDLEDEIKRQHKLARGQG